MSVDVGPAGPVNGHGATFSQNALKMSVETLMQHQHQLSSSARDTEKASKKHDEEEGFTRSISLYWSWVRGQKAAARLGQGLANNSTALILQCEHWLEAADPKHRYGTNLRPYFDYWLNQQAKARDAASAMHTYISYSAIPEIAQAAQAAAEANNAASCGAAEMQVIAADATTEAGAEGQAAAAGHCHPHTVCEPPATPRRSRSAPNLADMNMPQMSPSSAAAAAFAAAVAANAASTGTGDSAAAAATPEGHRVPVLQHFPTFTSHEGVAGSSSKYVAAAAAAEEQQQHEQVWPLQADHSSGAVAGSGAAPQITPAASITLGMTTLNSSPNLPGIHTDDRFFYWLDEGAGRHVDLADRGVSRSKLESERVQYLTESERNQLEVTVDPSTGQLVYKVSGHLVHTGSELSLVQLRAGSGAAAAAAAGTMGGGAAAAAGANGAGDHQPQGVRARLPGHTTLQLIPESCREDDEDEDEDEQPEFGEEAHEQQQQQSSASEQQGRHQQQRAALRQLQQDLRQHSQPMRIDACGKTSRCQQQQNQQQQQHFCDSAVADVAMSDADADAAADVTEHACYTPSKAQGSISKETLSSAAAAAAGAAGPVLCTPTAAAYGAVAGQSTPGTTCISQRQQSPAVSALQQQQQQFLQQVPLHHQPPGHLPAPQQQSCTAAGVEPAAAGGGGGTAAGHGTSLLQIKEKPSKWIYVLDTSGRLFVHAKFRGKFHHSSFLQGGAVLSAGGIVVEHGRIMKLTADSGHYRPNFDSFMSTVQLLKDWGADLTQTKLSAKHIKCPQLPDATST